MKKNWKKLLSVLLLAALLCALPGNLAWADEGIVPAESQTEGEGGGAGTSSTTPDTSTSGTTDNQGSSDSSSTTGGGTDTTVTEGTGTGSATSETDTTGETDTSGTSGAQGSSDSDLPTVIVDNSGTTSTPVATPTPTPEATPTPTPTPTATPTPTPAPPVITKDPTDETVDVGGDCWFIADYSNALYAVWHFVSPDGKTDYRYNDPAVATAFPGLKIENGDQSKLHLSSIPAQMNGWGSYCEYSNNTGSVRTKAAVVYVSGAPTATPTPSPSATTPTPTATPSPTPSPAASATPAPSSSPSTSPSPAVSPTPEGTGEPPAALNRGGKIFLLFGAAALVVGAAAIGTILLVSKRMSAKEAYTYKNGSRRRK